MKVDFTLKYPDSFYDLNLRQRYDSIGKTFMAQGKDSVYFPVKLHIDCFNYGHSIGLISVTSPILHCKRDGINIYYLGVGVYSPDDLDLDLCFGDIDSKKKAWQLHRQLVVHIKTMPKKDIFYSQFLKDIQNKFGGRLETV